MFAACTKEEATNKNANNEASQEKDEKEDEKEEPKEEEKDEAKEDEKEEPKEEEKEEPKEEPKEEDEEPALGGDEAEIEAIVESCMTGLMEGDDAALMYVAEDSDIYAEFEEVIQETQSIKDGLSEMGLEEAVAEDLVDQIFEKISVSVDSVEVDGDKATAKCTLSAPDFESMDSAMDDELQTEIFESLTEEEMEAIENGDQEVMSKVMTLMLEKGIEKMDTATETSELELEKIDGEWLIVGEKK